MLVAVFLVCFSEIEFFVYQKKLNFYDNFPFVFLMFSDQLASNVLWLSEHLENTKSVLINSGCVCRLFFREWIFFVFPK